MFWSLLGYIVAKACASPRNSTWFTRPFLLVRGWGLGTTLTRSSLFCGSEFGLWDRAGTWKLSHSSGLTTRSTPPATLQIPSCHVIGHYPDKFTDVTDQKPDTVLLHHRAVSRHSSVTSQGSIQTQFCYVTGQYSNTVLLHHKTNNQVQFCYVTVEKILFWAKQWSMNCVALFPVPPLPSPLSPSFLLSKKGCM